MTRISWSQPLSHFTQKLCGESLSVLDKYSTAESFIEHVTDKLFMSKEFKQMNCVEDVIELFEQVILHNAHVPHTLLVNHILQTKKDFIDHHDETSLKQSIAEGLVQFAKRHEHSNVDNTLIKMERAYMIIADFLEDDTFIKRIDALENEDFSYCMSKIVHQVGSSSAITKWAHDDSASIRVTCPMKVALSSANNSDRYGAAKMEGSRVLNMAVNLRSSLTNCIEPTISARIELIADQKIEFIAYNDMTGSFQHSSLSIDGRDQEQLKQMLCVPEGKEWSVENAFTDINDGFRFYKYALAFSGIVQCFDYSSNGEKVISEDYIKNPSLIWRDISSFTGGKGLLISLANAGPSKSGFSSSSAVMTTLLTLCYHALQSEKCLDRIYDLALLAENELALRTGWNDTYTLMPGIHDFQTEATEHAPQPTFSPLSVDLNTDQSCKWLEKYLCLIHTGIQRRATSRMNRRHYVYLSRDPETFPYLVKSILIHDKIVKAVLAQNAELLGHELLEYMKYRIGFDPDATSKYLQYLFTHLQNQKLIHGGLLAGAMGGGIAQVIATDYGLETVETDRGKISRLEHALAELKQFSFDGETTQVFNNPLFGRIEFAINRQGIQVSKISQNVESETAKNFHQIH